MPKSGADVRERVAVAWKEIEAVVRQHRPGLVRALGRPATDRQIDALEGAVGHVLPPALVQSLRIHNGVRDVAREARLFRNEKLLSTTEIARQWRMMESLRKQGIFGANGLAPSQGVKPGHWIPGWIPITDNEGDGYHVDLDPGAGGGAGQILYFWHDGARAATIVAADYLEWLRSLPAQIREEAAALVREAGPVPKAVSTELPLFLFFISHQKNPSSAAVLRYRPAGRAKAKDLFEVALRDGLLMAEGEVIRLSERGKRVLVEAELA
ncbi:hypothetical protein ANRL2_00942 [Anaerolineae bacterium]|nr:hypothetical protein ANRL2_00942 [Anaerolineae bacterium]